MADSITVPLTDKERDALNELARIDDLPPEWVMIQALRLYQMVKVGGAEVVMSNPYLKKAPIPQEVQ